MPNFGSTTGKKRGRGFWSRESRGKVLLLSDLKLSDARKIAKNPLVTEVICPENDREIYQAKVDYLRRHPGNGKITVVPKDFMNCIDSSFTTFIPDLQDPWSDYAAALVGEICKCTQKESILFLTVSRYNGNNGRFLRKPGYSPLRTRLDYIVEDLEEENLVNDRDGSILVPGGPAAQNGCTMKRIPRSIFEYAGVPAATSKSLSRPPMFHLGYRIVRETK